MKREKSNVESLPQEGQLSDGMRLVSYNETAGPTPLLSIVVAAYNHEAFISICVASILESTHAENIELVVIDDGSHDRTLQEATDALCGAALKYRVYSKPNKGLTDSLHYGLHLAHGQHIAFIASDDIYLTSGLDLVMDKLERNGGLGGAEIFQANYVGKYHGPVYKPLMKDLFAKDPAEIEKAISLEYPKPLLLQSTVFERRLLLEIDPWLDRLVLDDWPTFLRVAQHFTRNGGSFKYDPSIVLCQYRVHSGGIHKDLDRQLNACLEVGRIVVNKKFRKKSIANIYLDRSLNYAAQNRLFFAFRLFAKGFMLNPSAQSVSRLATRVARKMLGN